MGKREDKGAVLGLKAELLPILLKKGEINEFFSFYFKIFSQIN